jgi:hypothetical protein
VDFAIDFKIIIVSAIFPDHKTRGAEGLLSICIFEGTYSNFSAEFAAAVFFWCKNLNGWHRQNRCVSALGKVDARTSRFGST